MYDLPELASLGTGRGLVRIPMELDVPFTPRVRAVVDTAEFQRLSRITQLGLASRVYPGATHTRFEHALGVFHNALRYLDHLQHDERFRAVVTPRHATLFVVSSLLHDLGHWPFCHPIEDMALEGLPPHEEFAAEFLAPGSPLAGVLESQWGVTGEEVLDVLVKKSDTPALRLVRSMLSGPIDVDKMDYLDRDSLHAGVPYGRNFDRHRLVQSLVLNEVGDGLAISTKGRTAAELMVFARYVMFSEVYWHHAVRSATTMFARSFFELHERLDLRAFFTNSEAETIAELREHAAGTAVEPLVEGLFGPTRRLHKRLAEFSVYLEPELYTAFAGQPFESLVRCGGRIARALSERLGTDVAETDVLVDAPPPHREVEFAVDIHFPKENVYRPLREVSPVVEALAARQFDDCVKRVRVFGAADLAGRLPDHETFVEIVRGVVRDEFGVH